MKGENKQGAGERGEQWRQRRNSKFRGLEATVCLI